MKKNILTFLLILMVLVPVYSATDKATNAAAGSNTLVVTYTLLEEAPTFDIVTTSGVTENKSAALGVTETAVLSENPTEADRTVAFAIRQTANARTYTTYTMTVTATDLVLVKYSNGTAKTGALLDNEKFTVDSTTPAVTVSKSSIKGNILTTVDMATFSATNNVMTAVYKGIVAASSTNPVTLATFSCTYGKNADAVSGDYQSTIVMTVTVD